MNLLDSSTIGADIIDTCDLTYTLYSYTMARQIALSVYLCTFTTDSVYTQSDVDAYFQSHYYLNSIGGSSTYDLAIPGFQVPRVECEAHLNFATDDPTIVINESLLSAVDGSITIPTDSARTFDFTLSVDMNGDHTQTFDVAFETAMCVFQADTILTTAEVDAFFASPIFIST
jgi:hypothetical protein